MNKIIEFTNSEEFKIHGNLQLQKLIYDSVNSVARIHIQTELNDSITEWKIVAENPVKIGAFENYNFLNYREISLLKEHPLISSICGEFITCEVVGKPKDKFSFFGELCYDLEKVTGNWVPINEIIVSFRSIFEKKEFPAQWNEFIEGSENEIFQFPKFLLPTIQSVCSKYSLKITNVEEVHNVFNYDNEMLIFGNEIVSENEFYLSQPFIIAEKFILE